MISLDTHTFPLKLLLSSATLTIPLAQRFTLTFGETALTPLCILDGATVLAEEVFTEFGGAYGFVARILAKVILDIGPMCSRRNRRIQLSQEFKKAFSCGLLTNTLRLVGLFARQRRLLSKDLLTFDLVHGAKVFVVVHGLRKQGERHIRLHAQALIYKRAELVLLLLLLLADLPGSVTYILVKDGFPFSMRVQKTKSRVKGKFW
mmetsp:Transcript_19096/g.48546  ORF Transcript_19096/g.48546 Transcript_19096/m.48546 type:complete len:205 (+) Transcript_19096:533-1147(+)